MGRIDHQPSRPASLARQLRENLVVGERGMEWNGLKSGWGTSVSAIVARPPVPGVPF
jgi:hypothetical protein